MEKSKISGKSKQAMLFGGSVEDYEAGKKLFALLAEMLSKPIIEHVGWETAITPEQKERIKIERMKQIAEAEKNGGAITEATDYEALVYLMTASLASPLSTEAFHIYAYLFRQFYPKQAEEILAVYEGRKLEEWTEKRELQRLKEWLFKASKKVEVND